MKNRFGFLALFLVTIVLAITSCTPKDPTGNSESKISIIISQVASSSTGATISWTDNKGDNEHYSLRVYTDAECSNLYQEYELTFDVNDNKRFSIPYLDCENTYYVQLENNVGYTSKAFELSLSTQYIHREILSQNFDNLFWGYDYINQANGVILNEDNKPASYIVDNLTDARYDSHPTTKIDDNGGLLFKYRTAMVKKMGFEGWSGTDVRILPGYIKLGNSYDIGVLKTPALTALENESEDIEIRLKACIFASSLQANGGKIHVSVFKGDGSLHSTKDFNVGSVSGNAKWTEFKFEVEGVTADCYCEIKSSDSAKQVCIDDLQIVRQFNVPEGYIYGYTYDRDTWAPIEGVAVSDGFTVVTTDKDGLYMLKPSSDAWYVYYSVPAHCEVLKSSNGPRFYSRITKGTKEYNFELKLLPDGKKEEKFALLTFADPQVSSDAKLKRFKNEAIPSIKEHAKSLGIPCYGITLGDIVSTSTSDADLEAPQTRANTIHYMEPMREAMRPGAVGFPIFQVMGNHDCKYCGADQPIEPDEFSSTFQLQTQRAFETTFGPINYSFNRGDVHIIGMRDIVYSKPTSTRDYATGFLKEQYEWLKQDLAVVPKDKMVVLCVHIPLYSRVSSSGESGHYVKEVHKLLDQFEEAHIISGHTHIQRNYIHSSYDIYEHNMGTVCGTWWTSNVCGDGTPNGYGVFIGEGNTFSDWYYMGYHRGMNTRATQMRLYRGNAVTGAEKADNKNGVEGYYGFNFGDDVILANVFNADSKWKIEVYEDGELTGTMKLISDTSATYKSELTGSYTFDDPRRIKDGVEAGNDMWVVGIHMGVQDRYSKSSGPSNGSWSGNTHMYKYKLQNKDAKVKVVAIDYFGNRYEETKFYDYRDNAIGIEPNIK
ncbi:MAG: calcineurin-like phosphoesterase C-terminal domain-containing protein [Alistipes sp.]|nr:calcineurin-like phosphoesterase C-terminal domain-containing protein [Alistipes sp.]